jgi:protein-disulfide isomerase
MLRVCLVVLGLLMVMPISSHALDLPHYSEQDEPDEPTEPISIDALAADADDSAEFDLRSLPVNRTEDGSFVLGDPDAPLTLVEFGDYTCPFCLRYEPTIEQFIETYVATGQARYEYRLFPTAGGQTTVLAARYAECAGLVEPGAFFEAQQVLYQLAFKERYDENLGRVLAGQLGMNFNKLRLCTRNAALIETDTAFARSLGVGGTPAVMIRYGDAQPVWIELDGEIYNQGGVPFEVLAAVVEAAAE